MGRIYHECRICGCNLDPGEGLICDECKQKELEEKRKREELNKNKGEEKNEKFKDI